MTVTVTVTAFDDLEGFSFSDRRRMAAAARAAARSMFDEGATYLYRGQDFTGYSCIAISRTAALHRLSFTQRLCLVRLYPYIIDSQLLPFQNIPAGERLGRRVLSLLFLAAIVDCPEGAQA